MASNIEFYEAILKENYAPAIAHQVWRKTVALQEFEKTGEYVDLTGRYFYVPLELGLNEGIGAGGEYDGLPTPTNEIYASAIYYSTQQTGVVQLSLRSMQGSKSKEAAYANIQDVKFESITRNLRMDINRQIFGDGTGKLATVSSSSESSGNTVVAVDSVKYLRKNMHVDIMQSGGTARVSGKQILAVDKANNTFTISGTTLGIVDTDFVTRAGTYGKEIDGFAKIVSATGAVGGVDPATAGYEEWAASYVDTVGGAVSFSLFEKPMREIRNKSGGSVDLIIASPGVVSAAAAHFESYKRIPLSSNTITLPGGYQAVKWSSGEGRSVALTEDIDCPEGTAYFLAMELTDGADGDDKALAFGQLSDPGWMDLGEGILKWAGDRTYKAIWVWDMNLITLHRNMTAVVKNITEI